MAGLSLRHVYKTYYGSRDKKKISFKRKKDEGAQVKRSAEFTAVKDFNMEIEDGEFIVFVGPSGCGKSTTLRMIAGLEEISEGELYIDGKLVNRVEPKDRDIAMVFQSYALYPHMTAYNNIAFGLKMRRVPVEKMKDGRPVLAIDKKKVKATAKDLKITEAELASCEDETEKSMLEARVEKLKKELEYYKTTPLQAYKYRHVPKKEIDEKVKWAASVLGIEELLDSKPAAMSGGQRQRIALGRAMVRGPKVFLLDEPLSNLDAKLRTAMRSEIVKLHDELKTTFIYVTHDQIEAMTMGTRIVVMKLGVIQQIDTPTNLFDYPENKFVAGFIGTPQMNFFDVTAQKVGDGLEITFINGYKTTLNLKELRTIKEEYLDGQPHEIVMGVRGERIGIAEGEGLKTTLRVNEVLGSTTQLFVNLEGCKTDYVVCIQDRINLVAGDSVSLSFTEKYIHMFDKDSELSIMSRETGN